MKIVPDLDGERRELARTAKELLATRAFTQAVLDLRKDWFGMLMSGGLTKEREGELLAQLRALEAIPQRLESMIRNQLDHDRRRA